MIYFVPLISLIAAFWVFYDSQKRGYSVTRGLLWAIGVFLVLIVFLPLYLVLRKKKGEAAARGQAMRPSSLNPCFYCGHNYEGDPKICPHCGQNLKMM